MANIWPLYSTHFDELTAAIEGLPSPVLERYPVLRIVHRMTPVLARTSRPFKPLLTPDDARTMSPDELDILTLVQMVAFRFSGDVAAALIYARRLEDRILQIRVESRERADGPLWFYHQQIGSTLLAAGDSSNALVEFATSRQLGRLSPQPDAERMALGRTALAHALRGSLEEAEAALAELALQPASTGAHVNSTTMTERTAIALIAVERMTPDIDALLNELEPYDSIELTWPFALLARTRALHAQHRPDEAVEAIRLANDAHPDQHGSFASDVINSASIDALWATGATGAARRIAESTAGSGLLTRFSIVRHSLLESRLDFAEQGIRRLSAEHTMGPGHRAELILLSAWLESARLDAVELRTARQVARLASKGGVRRLLSTMPLRLIEQVREHLPAAETAMFETAISGLAHVDAPRRPVLTSSELRVLNALPLHVTTAEIASQFHVSPNTVKSQLKSLYRKLGCTTREDAIKIASRLHLFVFEME
ncbi:hypothetical protein ASD65_10840 [Microbacterium sp. Root61]|nr:hypothetical protein ASD65_10840 [Microbacterium sp. Root61]